MIHCEKEKKRKVISFIHGSDADLSLSLTHTFLLHVFYKSIMNRASVYVC